MLLWKRHLLVIKNTKEMMFMIYGIMPYTLAAAGFNGQTVADEAVRFVEFIVTAGQNLLTNIMGMFSSTISSSALNISAFQAAGTSLAALLMIIELCSVAMGFHFEDINETARFLFKVVMYKIIIENSSKIVTGTIGLFSGTFTGLAGEFSVISTQFASIRTELAAKVGAGTFAQDGLLGLNKFFVALGIFALAVVVALLLGKICLSVAGVIFEIGIHIVVAPVATATLVNHETRSLGINYIKSLAGTCMTIGVYGVCFKIYSMIYAQIDATIQPWVSRSAFTGGSMLIPPIVSLFLLSVAVKNAGNVVQRALG